jgi:3',5'-cyclic AMP phosphodiesterase CpdA
MTPPANGGSVRIAHATDIHWFAPPFARMSGKRIFGTLNLYVAGRRKDFDPRVQADLVRHLRETPADVVLITGDLTAQALPEEFARAREDLDPLIRERPTLVLPGNHDVYTRGATREHRFHGVFGDVAGRPDQTGLIRKRVAGVEIVGLDPNRPLLLRSSGRIPEDQLAALAALLADPAERDVPVVLAVHYPPVDRKGAVYDDAIHGLENARALIDVLDRAPRRPLLVACGHVHHGFRSELVLSDGVRVPVLDCGSSGHAFQPDRRRAAATATYTVGDGAVRVDRWIHDGTRFAPEPGGAFATGR